MNNTSLDLKSPPKFRTDHQGRPTAVTLDTPAYITLLVRSNVTNPALWPPGMKKGARWLERVRHIEADCIAQHGEFDWEKLPKKLQDEYNDLCALLGRLQDSGQKISLEAYTARRKESKG